MKIIPPEALAALERGDAVVSAAVRIALDTPARFWGGFGPLVISGETYVGVGDRGMVSATRGAIGTAEYKTELKLSGVDPDSAAQLDLRALRGRGVVIRRLIFDSSGSILLGQNVWLRGRVDLATLDEMVGGASTLVVSVEGAARGLGRRSERMRSDADQRLIDPTDGGMRRTAFAGEKTIYWGGKVPARAGRLFQANTNRQRGGSPQLDAGDFGGGR